MQARRMLSSNVCSFVTSSQTHLVSSQVNQVCHATHILSQLKWLMLMLFWSYSHKKVNSEIRSAGINIFFMHFLLQSEEACKSAFPLLSHVLMWLIILEAAAVAASFFFKKKMRNVHFLKRTNKLLGAKYVQLGSHKTAVFLASKTVTMTTSRLHPSIDNLKRTMKEFQLELAQIYLKNSQLFFKKVKEY